MPVTIPSQQHNVMIEAVENHMPQVIVIDEIGTEAEAMAARTIAERGVQLIGTAHGQTLENLLMNRPWRISWAASARSRSPMRKRAAAARARPCSNARRRRRSTY